jgi:hypothetical protein
MDHSIISPIAFLHLCMMKNFAVAFLCLIYDAKIITASRKWVTEGNKALLH